MTIHHFDIFGCPFCGHLYRSPVYGSYNTFSAKYWADGAVTGGIPQNYPIMKCQNKECNRIFFKEDAIVVGETINTDSLHLPKELLEKCPPNPPEWDNATHIYYARPDFKDLCDFMDNNLEISPDRKFTLIKECIKRFNDNYRESDEWKPTEDEQNKMNGCLRMMIGLIENSDMEEDRLSLAEYYRELAEFQKAQEILKNIKNENLLEIKEKLFSLARQHKSRLLDLKMVAVRKEYCCSNCKKGVFVYDLDKLKTELTYGVGYCRSCHNIGSINLTLANPVNFYSRNLFQRLFIKYKPIVPVKVLKCPLCDSNDVVSFDIEHDKCPFCQTGCFELVEWDW